EGAGSAGERTWRHSLSVGCGGPEDIEGGGRDCSHPLRITPNTEVGSRRGPRLLGGTAGPQRSRGCDGGGWSDVLVVPEHVRGVYACLYHREALVVLAVGSANPVSLVRREEVHVRSGRRESRRAGEDITCPCD